MRIMGVLNVTPDSFLDGGKYFELENALEHARYLVENGVDIIDIGGESTRPGCEVISVDEELERVIPVVKAVLCELDALVSVDTYKPQVAQACLDLGAHMINDIYGSVEMNEVASKQECPLVVMHHRGHSGNRSQEMYENVVQEVYRELERRIEEAQEQGVKEIIIDPGFGFSKTGKQNYELLMNLEKFHELGYPLLLGLCGKTFWNGERRLSVDEVLEIGSQKGAMYARRHFS